MYELIFDPEALEFLEKLEKPIARRIWNKIMATKTNPFHFFERLSGRKDYKLRIGDYRIIADIFQRDKTIAITTIGRRKDVYKNP
ncbi:MAG: type II toxin-antitoxin system RelE/ParE family toxin [Nanoarchaeota archaeon]